LRGEYRIRDPKLKPLFNQAKALLEEFSSHRLVHVPREQNTEADRLANEAINAAIRPR
jgi:ribonuclease HI